MRASAQLANAPPSGRAASAEPDKCGDCTTHRSILEGIKQLENTRAWERFYDVYAPVVYRYARHARLQEVDAADAVQIVMRRFVTLVRGKWTYQPPRGRFSHYLKCVANRVISAVRAGQPRTIGNCDFSAYADHECDDANWEQTERQERLRTCLERIREKGLVSPRDLDAFERFAIEQQDAEVVAAAAGISVNRLYGIKHEVTRKLRAVNRGLSRALGEA